LEVRGFGGRGRRGIREEVWRHFGKLGSKIS
jgi:hypothetical protein